MRPVSGPAHASQIQGRYTVAAPSFPGDGFESLGHSPNPSPAKGEGLHERNLEPSRGNYAPAGTTAVNSVPRSS